MTFNARLCSSGLFGLRDTTGSQERDPKGKVDRDHSVRPARVTRSRALCAALDAEKSGALGSLWGRGSCGLHPHMACRDNKPFLVLRTHARSGREEITSETPTMYWVRPPEAPSPGREHSSALPQTQTLGHTVKCSENLSEQRPAPLASPFPGCAFYRRWRLPGSW